MRNLSFRPTAEEMYGVTGSINSITAPGISRLSILPPYYEHPSQNTTAISLILTAARARGASSRTGLVFHSRIHSLPSPSCAFSGIRKPKDKLKRTPSNFPRSIDIKTTPFLPLPSRPSIPSHGSARTPTAAVTVQPTYLPVLPVSKIRYNHVASLHRESATRVSKPPFLDTDTVIDTRHAHLQAGSRDCRGRHHPSLPLTLCSLRQFNTQCKRATEAQRPLDPRVR